MTKFLISRGRVSVKCIVSALLFILWLFCTGATHPQTKIAVLPFANATKAPDLEWLSKAMSGTLIANFGFVKRLSTVHRIAVYRTIDRLPPLPLEQIAAIIAAKFQVDFVILGSFTRDGEHLTVTVHLFRPSQGVATETVAGNFRELLRLQDDLTERLLAKMNITPTTDELAAMRRDPTNSVEAYITFSRAAYAWDAEEKPDGDVDEAMGLLKEAVRLDPTFYKAWVNLGLAYERKGNWQEAKRCYEQAINHQPPDFPLAHYNLAGVYLKLGDLDKAMAECDAALRADPNFTRAYVRKGFIYFTRQRYREAIDAYQMALRFEPDLAMAYNNLGLAYQAVGRIGEAKDAFRRAIELDNDDLAVAYAHNNLGNLLRRQSDLDGAMQEYLLAIRRKPDYAVAWANLGDIHAKRGNFAEAVRCYEEALRLNPNIPRLRERLRDARSRLK